MKRTLLKLAIVCFYTLLFGTSSYAQAGYADTSARQATIDNMIANYNVAIGDQARLYNGPEYNFYSRIISGSAYFSDAPDFVPGTVTYDGFTFKNVAMLYDLYKDVVVMQLPGKVASVQLLSERVESFDLLGHHFIRIDPALTPGGSNLAVGFYDQLYNSKSELLVRREKVIQNSNSAVLDTYFTPSSAKMYLKINGVYKSFDNEKSMLTILEGKKKELKQYIKDKKISFKENKEQAMVSVITYYDLITN